MTECFRWEGENPGRNTFTITYLGERMRRTKPLQVTALESREALAGDLVYALSLGGLTSSSITRIAADNIGNTYVTGTFTGTVDLNPSPSATFNVTSKGGTDIFVAKYSVAGTLLWARTLGSTGDDSVTDIAFDNAQNSYIVGTINGTADFNPDPNIIANLTSTSGGSAFLWKLGFNGTLVSANMVNGKSSANTVAVDENGNVALAGQFFGTADFNPSATATTNLTTTNANGAGFIWKFDNTGAFRWAEDFQTNGSIKFTSIALDQAGNVAVGAQFMGVTDFDPTSKTFNIDGGSFWTPGVVKIGLNGNFLWAKSATVLTGSANAKSGVVGVRFDPVGGVLLAGNFAGSMDFNPTTTVTQLTSLGGTDGFAWKFDINGNFLWAKRFGTTNNDVVTDLSTDGAFNPYIVGQFTGTGDFDPGSGVANLYSGTGENTFLLKLYNNGNFGFVRSLGNGNGSTNATGIWNDEAGNAYVTGTYSGTVDFDPSAVVRSLTTTTTAGFIAKIYTPFTAPSKPANNSPQAVSPGGPYTINEGGGFSPRASATDPDKDTLTYSWDLNGDGVFGDATGASPNLTAAQMAALGLNESRSSKWNVSVRVSDGVNLPVVASTTLQILNVAPRAGLALGSSRAFEGTGTYVQFRDSSDPSAGDTRAGFRYSFDLNGDGVFDVGNGTTYAGSASSSLAYLKNQFAESGTFTVLGRIFDRDGGFRDYAVRVTFLNLPPTAKFSYLGPLTVGSNLTFNFSNVKDSTPGDRAAGFTYSFDWDNNGVFDQSGTSATASHAFTTAGTYKVRGRITDRDGGFSETLLTLVIK